MVERDIDLGGDGRYLIAVAGDASEIDDETHSFDRAIIITFTALTMALLLTTAFGKFVSAWRRSPAFPKASPRSGPAVPSGWRANFRSRSPRSRAKPTPLIEAYREIVERARTHVGNLAHALKTPLSVIVNEAVARQPFCSPTRFWNRPTSCAIRWRVSSSARLAARSTVVGTLIEVPLVVTALARSMEKLYRARDIAIDIDVPTHARFRGEQQDLEEMIGNLVDNGCKWA